MFHVTVPLMIAGGMPFALTAIAKAGAFSVKDNAVTRAWQAQLSGWRQRAHWAHQNAFEAFPLFAAAVIVAHLAAPESERAPIAAWGFVAARAVYGACYIADMARLRSVVWFASIVCVVALFSVAL